MSLFVKSKCIKYDFNESRKWLCVARIIPNFIFEKWTEKLDLMWASCNAAAHWLLLHESCYGYLPTYVGVLLKDPSNGPWGVVIKLLDPLYYIYIFKVFLQVLDFIVPS